VFMVTQILAGILLVIGPIVLPFALFDRTLGWVDRWLSSLMGKMLTFLCTAIVVSLMLGVIQDAFQSLPSPSQATAGVYQLLGVGVIAVVLAAAMGSLPFVIGHIAAASGLPRMDYASRALGMAGSAATGAAGRGVRGILGS
jgi:type IV secretory pathway VirB6-like protein